MGRIILLSYFFLSSAYALVPENIFQNDHDVLEKILANHTITRPYFEKLPSKDKFDLIKKDPRNLILDDFFVPNYFEKRVHFWFNVYTQYPSTSVVLHDTKDLNIVYNVIDFSELQNSIINKHTTYSLQVHYTKERIKRYREAFVNLSKGKKKDELQISILKSLDRAGYQFPSRKKRKRFFLNLSKNIRAQTGQKDHILQGYKNYLTYKDVIHRYFKVIGIPKELLAIPFLESSFNTKATSKVGATGIWQFMPFIGKLFLPVGKNHDARDNPVIATLGALHLLKQNKQILKRWDLAVTAYNSGTKHIVRARRKFKKKDMSLEYMLRHYRHPHIGFASSNFYSSFLALVHALAYKKELLGIQEDNEADLTFNSPIELYVTKCSFRPSKIYKLLKKSSPDFDLLNQHFKRNKYKYSRGSVIVSDVKLTPRKYFLLKDKHLRKNYPRNFKRLIKGQSCSTK